MAKNTLKLLRCEHQVKVTYVWPFYNIIHERVNDAKAPYTPKCEWAFNKRLN